MIRAIGVGDNFIDRYLFQNVMYVGGNSLNFAVYAKMLGHESAYCGVLAQDPEAQLICQTMERFNICYDHCVVAPNGETGKGSIRLVNGDRVITDDNDNGSVKHTPLQITPELIKYFQQFDLIHSACFGFLESQLPMMRTAGVPIAYDFSEEWTMEGKLEAVCPYVTIALFSGSGHAQDEIEAGLKKACELGCEIAISTVGAKGSIVYDGHNFYNKAPYNPESEIVDTIGAGDSFLTGFSTTYIDGCKRLRELMKDDLDFLMSYKDKYQYRKSLIEQSIHVGNAMAMKTCMTYGSFGGGVPIDAQEVQM